MNFSSKTTFVLDCSVTMAWCFEDEVSDYSENVLNLTAERGAIVPALWSIEVANTLTLAERKKRISHPKVMAFRKYLNEFLITIDDFLFKKPIEIIYDIARETKLTAYDATYLELALRKNIPLSTMDKALKSAARKIGVSIFED